ITDRDPVSKYICRKCYEQVEENYKFVIMCQTNNAKKMENETNEMVKTKYKKFMRLPFIDLLYKYQFDVKGLYDAVTSYLDDNNEDLSSTQSSDKYDGLNNHNSTTNQVNNENDNPVGNGIPEISPVFEVNEPQIFDTMCGTNNVKQKEYVTNEMLQTEFKKLMRLPFIGLINKYQFDIQGLFDAATSYLNDNNEHLTSTQIFNKYVGLNNHNSTTNQVNIENDNPVGNGIPEISPVLEVNEPQIITNEVNNENDNPVGNGIPEISPVLEVNEPQM
ncbi:bromodomain-containing protein DDB G0270170-like, partial [Aphis craccivora]